MSWCDLNRRLDGVPFPSSAARQYADLVQQPGLVEHAQELLHPSLAHAQDHVRGHAHAALAGWNAEEAAIAFTAAPPRRVAEALRAADFADEAPRMPM